MLNKKRKIIVFGIGIIVGIIVIIGASYAWWSATATQESLNSIQSDCLRIELEDASPALTLEKTYPLTDDEAKNLEPYQFIIKNVCNTNIVYDVNLEVLENENRLSSEFIAIEIDQGEKRILNNLPRREATIGIESYGIGSGRLKGKESKEYRLKLWMDEHVTINDDAMNKSFKSKVVVNASLNQVVDIYTEENLKGADPVLSENLIPVEIDENGIVTKANTSEEWYNYGNKRWANAVILEDESAEYNAYDVIPESNIESYFVWIPKYSYQLWDLGEYQSQTTIDESKVHEIAIRFGIENTSDTKEGECTTPGTSGTSGNCQVGDYMTHPAFLAFGTNGLWVGKFESGYKGATTTAKAQVNTSDSNKLQIKPNVYSWRGIQPANAHQVSYNYKRELESHMMKNTEWGAVAYLQYSKYGSSESVRINNNSSFITGYASVKEPTCGYTETNESCNQHEGTSLGVDGNVTINYKNPSSVVASTTGNYTGIYDMSGGAEEYVMGIVKDNLNSPFSGASSASNSGFNGPYSEGGNKTDGINFPDERYYDLYNYEANDNKGYNRRILGDATTEMGPIGTFSHNISISPSGSWEKDIFLMAAAPLPYFRRGASMGYGFGAGIFATDRFYGNDQSYLTFRTVLAI